MISRKTTSDEDEGANINADSLAGSRDCLPTRKLKRHESVLLSAALVSWLADQSDLMILLIKGPVAVEIGVRAPGDASDLDVLIAPGQIDKLCAVLTRFGWLQRENSEQDGHPLHSITMYNPTWPTDLDLHYMYPGFDLDPEVYFPFLWEHKQEFLLANYVVNGLDLCAATLVQALHSLREPNEIRNISQLEYLFNVAPKPSWEQTFLLAQQTGSLAALKPYLNSVFPQSRGLIFPRASLDWLKRTDASLPGVHRMLHLSELPWKERGRSLARGIFPSRELLQGNNLQLIEASRWNLAIARGRRLAHFIRSFPKAVKQYREFRKQNLRNL